MGYKQGELQTLKRFERLTTGGPVSYEHLPGAYLILLF